MDWPLAIERNRSALLRIVAELVAMAGVLTAANIPRRLHRSILAVLRPAESAVRRLIVVAARGLKVKPPVPRPMTAVIPRSGKPKRERPPQFQLFDSRKRFAFQRRTYMKPGTGPRITFFPVDDDPRIPLFRPPVPQAITIEVCPARTPSETVPAKSLFRRLAAIQQALENIPHQAKRLLRWQARRAAMKETKFRDPLRPGRAPGHRKRPIHEIDDILRECQWLAWEANRAVPNTS